MTDENIKLSRRKTLLGLGTVGAASIGAGMGTSAYFSDQVQFDGNTIQAGEFGLTVEQQVHNIDQDGIGPDEEDFDAAVSDNGGVWIRDPITIEDAKPGDEYEFCWDITVEENPGHVALAACYDDWTGVEADNVEPDDLWDIDDESELSTIGAETLVDDVTLEKGGTASYSYDTVGDLLADLETGALLDDGGDPVTFEPGETWTLCIELSIPTEVGNELQGALLEWDLAFYAEQARHNDAGGVADRAADSIVCGDEPECLECDTPPGSEDFLTIENLNDANYPEITATTRVETDAGTAGDLDETDFEVCETFGGDSFGQIETVDFGGEAAEVDVMIVFDVSGSMSPPASKLQNAKDGATTLVDQLGDGANVGLVTFSSSAEVVEELGTDKNTVKNTISGLSDGGFTAMGAGIEAGQNELTGPRGRPGANKVMVVLGNGGENQGTSPRDRASHARDAGTTIYAIAYGDGADEDLMEDISSPPKVDDGVIDEQDVFAFVGGEDDIGTIFADIGEAISGVYAVTYTTCNPDTDGSSRDVRVYVDDPDEDDADDTETYTAPSS